MAGISKREFRCHMLGDLMLQMQYFDREKKLACLERAEKLHDTIKHEELYPQDYLTYRITGVPAVNQSETLYLGEAVMPDLQYMIDLISRQLGLIYDPNAGIEMLTENELAERFNVSTKTIRRWRKKGLRWRHMKHKDTKRRANRYPADSVMRFQLENAEHIKTAGKFSRLDQVASQAASQAAIQAATHTGTHPASHSSEAQTESMMPLKRSEIVPRAREIMQTEPAQNWTIYRMAKRLAMETGRTTETIRLILVEHENKSAGEPLFKKKPGTIKPDIRAQIYDAKLAGEKVPQLMARFQRSRSSIHRFIREERAERMRQQEIQYYTSPLFDREDAIEVLLRKETHPNVILTNLQQRGMIGEEDNPLLIPDELVKLLAPDDLTTEEEHTLLVRMNYLYFLFKREVEGLPNTDPSGTKLKELDERLEEIKLIKSLLFTNAMRALWRLMSHSEPEHCQPGRIHKAFIDSLLEGAEDLIKRIESFDPWQGRTGRVDMHTGNQTSHSLSKLFIWKQMRRIAIAPSGKANQDDGKARAYKRMSKQEIDTSINELAKRFDLSLK